MATETLIIQQTDDEIVLSLVEQKMVVHDTVRIGIAVSAQRDDKTNEATMRASIKTALRKFIDAEWRFLSVNRQRGQSRFENVMVQAVARVDEVENVQLFERANEASTAEIQLVSPSATYALPFEKVQEINRNLRVALSDQARKECARYNEGKDANKYRVAEIVFADTPRAGGDPRAMRAGQAYANNVTAAPPSGGYGADIGVGAEEGAPDLGVTERFWVSAQVTLRAKN